MMTQLYADRLAEYGINVYEIRPGIIATDMTSGARAEVRPADRRRADAVPPLGSARGRSVGRSDDRGRVVFPFSTGEVINVDGGFHLRRL